MREAREAVDGLFKEQGWETPAAEMPLGML